MEVSYWEARDYVSGGADLGSGALAVCKALRGAPGVNGATYWVQGFGRIVILIETEAGTDFSALNANPEVAKSNLALAKAGYNVDVQTWMDPRAAAAALASGIGGQIRRSSGSRSITGSEFH
jgi:hypothetical protein